MNKAGAEQCQAQFKLGLDKELAMLVYLFMSVSLASNHKIKKKALETLKLSSRSDYRHMD